jgi:hypothetical protein
MRRDSIIAILIALLGGFGIAKLVDWLALGQGFEVAAFFVLVGGLTVAQMRRRHGPLSPGRIK